MKEKLDEESSSVKSSFPPIFHYYSFFSGQLISILGSEIVRFTLIWWITVETASSWYLSLAAFLTYGVKALISPISGVFADRWNRKKIIFIMDLLQSLCSILMIAFFFFNIAEIWNILLLMAISSSFAAFQDPTVNAIIPVMVPKDNLSRINSLIYFSTFIMRMIGPMLGALLLSIWSINQIIWLDFISFIMATIPLIFISIPHLTKIEDNETVINTKKKSRNFLGEFKEGVKIIKSAGILGITMVFPFTNLLETPKNILMPLLISKTYNTGALIFASIIMTAQMASALTSLTLTLKNIPDKVPRQKIVVLGLIGIFLASLIMIIPEEIQEGTQMGWQLIFLFIGIALMGICSPIVNITVSTVIQKLVPSEKLGRVNGVSSALSLSLMPLGTLFTGYIAENIGIRLIILCSGLIAICGITIFYFTSDLSNIDKNLAKTDLNE